MPSRHKVFRLGHWGRNRPVSVARQPNQGTRHFKGPLLKQNLMAPAGRKIHIRIVSDVPSRHISSLKCGSSFPRAGADSFEPTCHFETERRTWPRGRAVEGVAQMLIPKISGAVCTEATLERTDSMQDAQWAEEGPFRFLWTIQALERTWAPATYRAVPVLLPHRHNLRGLSLPPG
jgi:hypothetical protein